MHMWEILKRKQPPEQIKQEYLLHIQKHHTDIQIYTDASKGKNHTSIGITIPSRTITDKKRIPSIINIFHAELLAIEEAINMIKQLPKNNYTIMSDSKSALTQLSSRRAENETSERIRQSINELQQQNIKVTICWIPGHVGLMGNEQADQLAKAAANLPISPGYKIDINDICNFARRIPRTMEHWNTKQTKEVPAKN